MKKLSTMFIALLLALPMMAQHRIGGAVYDKEMDEMVQMASVALSRASNDKFVAGTVTDSIGIFTFENIKSGKYKIKITNVGFKPFIKEVTVKNGDVNLGIINLEVDAVLLKEATVTGQAAKLIVKEDTFVYNAAAYHTPEGSVLEELVRRLPGAQIDDSGKITINGKEVKKIKVDGKEFMTGDTETALKNLPTAIIDQIKAYDEKSDQARITGIDDGNEETVLDFGIKRGMNRGTMLNLDLGAGTQRRYSNRLMGSYMVDDLRVMVFGNANNVGDRGFPGGGGGWRGGNNNGLNSSKMVGLNLNYEKKDVIIVDGSVRWNHRDGDSWSKQSSESFIGQQSSFSNSLSQSYTRSNRWNAQMRIEWTPDSMTTILFRPNVSLSTNDNMGGNDNATFNNDPYQYVSDPLSKEGLEELANDGIVINGTTSENLGYSKNNSVGGNLQITRKFGNQGRNISLNVNGNYSDGESISTSTQNIDYYLQASHDAKRRYNTTPTKNTTLRAQATYSEPIAKRLYLQFIYGFQYSKQKSDRSTFHYDNGMKYEDGTLIDFSKFDSWRPEYRNWSSFLECIPGNNPFAELYLSKDLSKYSEYDNYTHEMQVMLRKNGEKLNFSAGLMMQPQNSEFKYKYMKIDTIVKRNVLNFSPTLDFRYKFDKVSQFRAQYNGRTSQPSMSDMLDITDDSNPLNITKGNPGLKPSFTQSFNVRYNTYSSYHMQSFMTFLYGNLTSNSISQSVEYNSETGVRTTRPENINGNWGAGVGIMYNASIDSTGVWNVNTFTNLNYNNNVSYLFQGNQNMKNKTRMTTIRENLSLSYRSELFDIEPNAGFTYTNSKNMLQSQSNLNTWSFNYGLNVTVNCPWGTSLSTNAGMNSRRGYNDASMNTNEFIWNAQLSQSFLKGRTMTVSLQLYDILHNQSNFSRTINALERRDSEYNNITSYAMLRVSYRFNNFGGKAGMQGGQFPGGRPDFSRPEFRGTRGGGAPGGAPGGRPGGFGGRF